MKSIKDIVMTISSFLGTLELMEDENLEEF